MSYDITTTVGKIRLLIGDKDDTNEVFTDAEITHFYTEAGSLNLAAAMALEAWAATYAANADSEKIGDYAYTQKIADKMLKLAKRFRDTEEAIPAFEWSQIDLTFGSGITREGD